MLKSLLLNTDEIKYVSDYDISFYSPKTETYRMCLIQKGKSTSTSTNTDSYRTFSLKISESELVKKANNFFKLDMSEYSIQPMSALTVTKEAGLCFQCDGVGINTEFDADADCEECDGDGEVELDNDYNDYICECKSCGGTGKVDSADGICDSCNGKGCSAGVVEFKSETENYEFLIDVEIMNVIRYIKCRNLLQLYSKDDAIRIDLNETCSLIILLE